MAEIKPLEHEDSALVRDGRKTVMIIDDSSIMTKQLTQILNGANYKVVGISSDGEEGMRLYRKISKIVDVVLLDINMPKMHGMKVLQHIMAFNKDARVVIVSTEGTGENVKKAITLGARGFVVKPPARAKVLEQIEAALK